MDRRSFLKTLGAAAGASIIAKPVFVHAKRRIRWRMVT
ncbi:twin-arginine translocation signal domain-containing protein, partial [Thermodesulfatator atlanticus]